MKKTSKSPTLPTPLPTLEQTQPSPKALAAARNRLFKRLEWQMRWFNRLSFPNFQTILRKGEMHDQLTAHLKQIMQEKNVSDITAGEAWNRVMAVFVDFEQREAALTATDEEVLSLWESMQDLDLTGLQQKRNPADSAPPSTDGE